MLSIFKIQSKLYFAIKYGRLKIPGIDITILNMRKWKAKRSHWSQTVSNSSRTNSLSFSGPECNHLCLTSLPSELLSLTLDVLFLFSWRIAYFCSWVLLLVCFLQIEFRGSGSLVLLCPLSLLFSPSWQCYCWDNILRSLVDLQCMCSGFTQLDKRLLHRFFLYNPISIFDFC